MINKISSYNNQPSFGTFKAIGNFTPEEEKVILEPIAEFSKQKFKTSKKSILSSIKSNFLPEIHVVINRPRKQIGSVYTDKTFEHCYYIKIYPFGLHTKPKDELRIVVPSLDYMGNEFKNTLQRELDSLSYHFRKYKGKLSNPEEIMKDIIVKSKRNPMNKLKYVLQTGED